MALKDWKKINYRGIPIWTDKRDKNYSIGIRNPKIFHTQNFEVFSTTPRENIEVGEAKTLKGAESIVKKYITKIDKEREKKKLIKWY
jgi:hypothetical protein